MKRCIECQSTHDSADWRCPECGFAPALIDGNLAFSPEFSSATSGFRPEVFSQLASLEASNFWFRARSSLLVWAIKRHFQQMRSFFEIGCGTGVVLSSVSCAFPGARMAGSEILSAGLPYAAERVSKADLFQMDARRIPYDQEFDVIGAFDVLEHIQEDGTVLGEIHRALAPGGGAIFTVPQHSWLWSSTDEYACHVRRYGVGELRQKLERAGFRVVFETSFVSLLLPLLYASRFSRKSAPAEDGMPELNLPPLLNRALLAAMAVERGMIKAGVRFPIGGSGLVVAKKLEIESE